MNPIKATAKEVVKVLRDYREYIMGEVLAVDIREGEPGGNVFVIECKED